MIILTVAVSADPADADRIGAYVFRMLNDAGHGCSGVAVKVTLS